MEPDFLKNIGWSIRVFSTDTLGFCQDTSKEDKEKEIIASWEEKEPGRAELAKKSRRRFLLEKKLENGKQLNEEEIRKKTDSTLGASNAILKFCGNANISGRISDDSFACIVQQKLIKIKKISLI